MVTDLDRRRSFLHTINPALLLMGVLALLAGYFFPEATFYTLAVSLVSFSTYFFVLYLIRKNKIKQAGLLFSGLIAVTFYVLLWYAMSAPVQNIMDNSIIMMLMGIPILFAGATIGRWAGILITCTNLFVQLVLIFFYGAAYVPTFSVNIYWWILALAIWLYETTLSESLARLFAFQVRLESLVEERTLSLQNAVEALKKSKRTLEETNKDLDSFTYSVSHDLRAPLRSIEGFSKALEEEYLSRLSENGLIYLQRIQANARLMSELIDDLLLFSRLGRQKLQKQTVDPTALVREIVDSLCSELEGRQVEFKLAELPHCQADPVLLRQVYVNLLENAIKFTRPRQHAIIEVGSQNERDKAVVYWVRDNGVGFDMRYADNLFLVFHRLHREDEFEGTGVGLATVKRVIQKHGGRVWAQAKVNQGATFFFTLT